MRGKEDTFVPVLTATRREPRKDLQRQEKVKDRERFGSSGGERSPSAREGISEHGLTKSVPEIAIRQTPEAEKEPTDSPGRKLRCDVPRQGREKEIHT